MAAVGELLTLEEFRAQYTGDIKPNYEYWFGNAIQNSVPTSPHGILQFLLMMVLHRPGFCTGSKIEPWIDPNWQPKPDVIAD